MLLMVESFHYFCFKVCLLGLLVNMYIFKLSKTYNKSSFQVLIYNLTLIFESFVKYFHKEIPVAALFFLFLSLSLGADYEDMEMNSGKPKEVFVQNRRILSKKLTNFPLSLGNPLVALFPLSRIWINTIACCHLSYMRNLFGKSSNYFWRWVSKYGCAHFKMLQPRLDSH